MSEQGIKLEIDLTSDAAYVELSNRPVARTVEHSPGVNVDLDDLGMVVGVEIIDLGREWPLADVVEHFHVAFDRRALVAQISNPLISQSPSIKFTGSAVGQVSIGKTARVVTGRASGRLAPA